MMFRYIIMVAVIIQFTNIVQPGDSHRILCIFPAPSISHQVVYRGLTLALNKRGHELIIVTPNPINDPVLSNYTEIDISFAYENFTGIKYAELRGKIQWIDTIKEIHTSFLDLTYRILDHPDLRKLYLPNNNQKFDLLIVEWWLWQSMYVLAPRFDVPMIGISSFGLSLNTLYTIGNPILSSHPSNWELEAELSRESSIWQRLKNFITIWEFVYWHETTYIPGQTAIARKYFGDNIPGLSDLEKNVSLIFVDRQGPISYARANVPKLIEIGGFHISKEIINLPKELQEILDRSKEGFVYVSLGTNAKSSMLPKKTITEFIAAFSRLPYTVLWKYEDDDLQDKLDNVHIMKWVPQQAVLAHPNLRVFVYQGGVQSTEEAVHHAVPLVGIPVFGDQDMQVNKMVSLGVAERLEITAVDANELFEMITSVASDARYKQRMLNLRSLMNDKPYDPLENAIWWTEYVIRHRGTPHLHSTTADEPWYTRQDMDIVALISAGFVIFFGSLSAIFYQSVKSLQSALRTGSLNAKKMN